MLENLNEMVENIEVNEIVENVNDVLVPEVAEKMNAKVMCRDFGIGLLVGGAAAYAINRWVKPKVRNFVAKKKAKRAKKIITREIRPETDPIEQDIPEVDEEFPIK